MNRYIDIHHHILYGLDDGPGSHEKMAAMLRMADAGGIGTIIATPHVAPGLMPVNSALIESRLAEARAFCTENRLDLQLFAGAEVLFTPALENLILQRRVPTLAGSRHVLLEFESGIQFKAIERAMRALIQGGYVPVLAHVERCRCMMRKPSSFRQLKSGCAVLYQMNCSALTERKGFLWRRRILWLLREQLIDFAATDAHDTAERSCNMAEFYRAVEAVAGAEYAKALTSENAVRYLLKEAPGE